MARAVPSRGALALQLRTQRDVTVAALEDAIERGNDFVGPLPDYFLPDDDEPFEDDALMRALWQRLENGPVAQGAIVHLLQETQTQQRREQSYHASAQRLATQGAAAPTPATTLLWSRIGPQSALSEYNGVYYEGLDGGRVATVRADPKNPTTIYVGAIGGGIWKTNDITLVNPVWTPLTDSLGTMFIGSFDIDPTDSAVIHAGLGDFWEGNPGGVMVTSRDAGATWSAPRPLSVQLNGKQIQAVNVRTVRIDPTNASHILVASDVGLFRSIDGGETYQPIDLPNTAAYGTDLEGLFSVVYIGNAADGQSTFLATGNYACPGGFPPSFNQPRTGFFVASCPAAVAGDPPLPTGNLGDIWKSVDGGATWTSARVAGILPPTTERGGTPPAPIPSEVGRINLSAIPGAASADTAVIYALASNQAGAKTLGVLKSIDGGASWTIANRGELSTPTNPTTNNDCPTLDIGHGQSEYDLAIAVDPGNPNNVLIGGNLCGARTIDGGATWQIVSHWLGRNTSDGPMPYVHADWHNALVVRANGKPITLATGDGGTFASFDVFDAPRGSNVRWFNNNVGLDTHLPYSIGSGEPSFGTAELVLTGLQDNGTRFRVSKTGSYVTALPMAWNQILGGDGFGTAVSSDPRGTNVTAWAVANGQRFFCRTGANIECSRATRVLGDIENRNWYPASPPLPRGDANGGFAVRYSPLYDAAGSVITNSNFNLWKISATAGNVPVITRLATNPPPPDPGGYSGCGMTGLGIRSGGPVASPFTYSLAGKPSRVYGLPLGNGCYTVLTDNGDPGGLVTAWPAKTITHIGSGNDIVLGTASITFPHDPTHLGGTDITQTYVVSSVADFLSPPITTPPTPAPIPPTPIPASTGHVFVTHDGGANWAPLHGNGTGFDLPNVRVYVIRFDPSDPTDQTLYAGTDLGLYRSTDIGQTWRRYGDNLPMVRVQDLSISLNGSLLRVAMYGRGTWEIYPRSDGASGLTGRGDFDKNGIIDYRDLNSLTNRTTVTPATTELPRYDNEMNLIEGAAATTVDDDDLNALLAKFGGVP